MTERLKKLRKTLDLTQQQFADKIGIKRNTMATYESGRNDPIDAVISIICRTSWNGQYVREDWLRNGTGEMFIEQTRDEEIITFIGNMQMTADDSFKKRFVSMLSRLEESDWGVLEKMALTIFDKKKD